MAIIIHFPKLKEYAVSRVNPNGSHGLWVIILNESSFIGCPRRTRLVWDSDSGRGCVYVVVEGRWETSTEFHYPLSLSFSVAANLKLLQSRIQGPSPGGSVVKNPPANAGDTGSIPGPRRSHMPQSN